MSLKTRALNLSRLFNSTSATDEKLCNTVYGDDIILKSYSGYDMTKPINGEITHGWYPNNGVPGYVPSEELKCKDKAKFYNKRFYVWNKRMEDSFRRLGFKSIVTIGAPFLYIPELVEPGYLGSKSIILFPVHSTETEKFYDAINVFKTYLKQVASIVEENFDNITICLGHRDYNTDGVKKIFKNYNVVTLGNKSNPEFLLDYQNLVNKYEYVSSNVFSTALFYALHMGKKAFILGNPGINYKKNLEWKSADIVASTNYKEVYKQILWENFDDNPHKEISDIELGVKYKRTPERLKELLSE